MADKTAYNNAKTTEFQLDAAHTEKWPDEFKASIVIPILDKSATLPKVKDFPLSSMKVGQSFRMHKADHWPGRFWDVRYAVRRCNATKAAFFVCVWTNNKQTLEIARLA